MSRPPSRERKLDGFAALLPLGRANPQGCTSLPCAERWLGGLQAAASFFVAAVFVLTTGS